MSHEMLIADRSHAGASVERPTDSNATAVVDRAIQTLKKDLAGEVARHGGGGGTMWTRRRKPTMPGRMRQ